MSGGEVLGLISGIIAIVDATLKVYNAYSSASSLPSTFRDVAARLLLVQDTLCAVLDDLTDEPEARPSAPRLPLCYRRGMQDGRNTPSERTRYSGELTSLAKADVLAGMVAEELRLSTNLLAAILSVTTLDRTMTKLWTSVKPGKRVSIIVLCSKLSPGRATGGQTMLAR
ncbi:hypothetical protein QQZ08_009473 [Neonectria magnoliae]|uniref:NACHT-NTPase and P-loop NTPases N-terminal domain-containing protein n=1 Tax=Neonectria magnoliae TaxID=2732573 RepID=A0ABR1HMP8_9HYPO